MTEHEQGPITAEILSSVSEIDEDAWDALHRHDSAASPFVDWRFLSGLEREKTLGTELGWVPQIPVIRRNQRIVAACPAYVKFHSHGEFVFDFAWAELAARIGVPYYPKLLVGVPFTPVTGARLLVAPDEDRTELMRTLGTVLVRIADELNFSSVHVNFAQDDEVQALVDVGFIPRYGLQYHWHRHGERGFDDYLKRFRSKRRNQLRRERREFEQQGLTLSTLRGEALSPELVSTAFELYKTTVDKFYWGRRYLNEALFHYWREQYADNFEFVCARDASQKVIAGAINFSKGQRLYGRYWGGFEDLRFLHFNVCYYHGIEECFRRELDVFEPGAGGEHKLVRGFEPTLTKSAHYVRHPRMRALIAQHLDMERQHIEQTREVMLVKESGRT